jgi:hypothetical protein
MNGFTNRRQSLEKTLSVISGLLESSSVKKKSDGFANKHCMPKNYPLEYTNGIILSIIDNEILSNFILTLCKIPIK